MLDQNRLERELERIRAAVAGREGVDLEDPGTLHDTGRSPVDEAAGLARVNAHWGITSDAPIVARVLILFRRVLRLTLRWYINPLVQQQNDFNQAVVRALYNLEARIEDLRPTNSTERSSE